MALPAAMEKARLLRQPIISDHFLWDMAYHEVIMSYLETIENVERLRRGRLFKVAGDGAPARLELPGELSTKASGLYWILTNYSDEELRNCTPSNQRKAVDMRAVATMHAGLDGIHNEAIDGFRVVYNGIGGGKKKSLRGRILDEFNGGEGTGSLGILKSSLNDLARWRVSYVTMGEQDGSDLELSYKDHAENIEITHAQNIERIWRVVYGWPVLCRG